MRQLQALYLILILAVLQACASYTAPASTEDKIMAGYASVGAAYSTISDLAKRRVITREQGMRLITRADEVKSLLDIASAQLLIGMESEASKALAFATTILIALETELKSKEVK